MCLCVVVEGIVLCSSGVYFFFSQMEYLIEERGTGGVEGKNGKPVQWQGVLFFSPHPQASRLNRLYAVSTGSGEKGACKIGGKES